jgi:hypothetical protein
MDDLRQFRHENIRSAALSYHEKHAAWYTRVAITEVNKGLV